MWHGQAVLLVHVFLDRDRSMKSIWKVRLENKPWLQANGECRCCSGRFLLESCCPACHVIVAYAQRHGLLFLKSTDPSFVLSMSDRSDPFNNIISRRSVL